MAKLKDLPNDKWSAPKIVPVRVNPSSVVQIDNVPYSVPTRLISLRLIAHVYHDRILLFYGQKCLQKMPKSQNKDGIDYRHIIDSLIRKPGAFANYQYKEALFPRLCFREAYDELVIHSKSRGHKDYLALLQLAKMHGEHQVATALALLKEKQIVPLPEEVKKLLDLPIKTPEVEVAPPLLAVYNELLSYAQNMEVAI